MFDIHAFHSHNSLDRIDPSSLSITGEGKSGKLISNIQRPTSNIEPLTAERLRHGSSGRFDADDRPVGLATRDFLEASFVVHRLGPEPQGFILGTSRLAEKIRLYTSTGRSSSVVAA